MIITIEVTHRFNYEIKVDVSEDYTFSPEELKALEQRIAEGCKPTEATDIALRNTEIRDINREIDTHVNWWSEGPRTKDKNPTPGEEFRFQLSDGRTWATDGNMVLSEGLWGRIKPIKHWRILSADEIALVESKIGAWKSGTPVHPGEFDPCFAPVIGDNLIWGLGVNEPGYLLDYCDDTDKWFVVGLLMPIGKLTEKE